MDESEKTNLLGSLLSMRVEKMVHINNQVDDDGDFGDVTIVETSKSWQLLFCCCISVCSRICVADGL